MAASFRHFATVLMAALLACGCLAHEAGSAAKEAAKEAPEPAITQSLRALNEPANQQRLGNLMEMPQVRDAARNLGEGLADGALVGLSDAAREERIRQLATQFVQAVSQAVSQGLGKDVTPAVTALAAKSVDAALREALSDGHLRQLDAFVGSLTQTLVTNLAQGMEQSFGPSLTRMLANDDFNRSLTKASRSFSQGLVLGMDDALTELDRQQALGRRPSLLGRLAGAANRGITLTTLIAIALGVIVVGLGLWIAKLMVQTRRDQAEAARREAAMTLMAEAIHATESKSWSPELKELLQKQFENQDAGPYLQSLLERQRQAGRGRPLH